MLRFAIAVGAAFLLVACSSAPRVYASSDLDVASPTGSIDSLSEILRNADGPVRMVFIHGVGDTCPGFALDKGRGWLNDQAAKRIGLSAAGEMKSAEINLNVFMVGTRPDAQAKVVYAIQPFSLRLDPARVPIDVEAVEITWSLLTQWIKTSQLSYDSPSIFLQPNNNTPCLKPPDQQAPPLTFPAPERLLLNQFVKELILDRNLADAMIYASPYSAVIERGVAEALCRVVNGYLPAGRNDLTPCIWPTREQSTTATRYLFVTHSLGSRILYDVVLNLTGHSTSGRPNPFGCDTLTRSTPVVSEMLAHTPAVYMMANQLSLIGITNVPLDARSGNGAPPRYRVLGPATTGCPGTEPVDARLGETPSPPFGDLLGQMIDLHAQAIRDSSDPRLSTDVKLRLVAFSDTNDLLTWHIPRPYAYAEPAGTDDRPRVAFVNVFVQNDAHWIVLESPATHNNYFKRADVWQTISCGAKNGQVSSC
jgi:hypothetical protein